MLSTLDAAPRHDKSPTVNCCPRSIYDILTQISNDFQRSLCRIQCRQSCRVRCTHGVSLLLFRRCFPLLFFIRHLYLSVVARLMSIMCTDERSLLCFMSRHAPYCWLATSLFWYSAPTRFLKRFWKMHTPPLRWFVVWIKWMCWAVSYFFNINFTSRTGNANNMDYLCNWCLCVLSLFCSHRKWWWMYSSFVLIEQNNLSF